MVSSDDEQGDPHFDGSDPEISEWDDVTYYEYSEESPKVVHLQKDDYIALFIASLETIFLPLVILIILLLVLSISIGLFW